MSELKTVALFTFNTVALFTFNTVALFTFNTIILSPFLSSPIIYQTTQSFHLLPF